MSSLQQVHEQPGPSASDTGRHVSHVVLGGLSAVTAVWLVLQLLAGALVYNGAYPITGYGMFSSSKDTNSEPVLVGQTGDGSQVELVAGDFDLTPLQLEEWASRTIRYAQDVPVADTPERLARVAGEWSRRDGRELVSVTLYREVHDVDAPRRPTRLRIAQWSA